MKLDYNQVCKAVDMIDERNRLRTENTDLRVRVSRQNDVIEGLLKENKALQGAVKAKCEAECGACLAEPGEHWKACPLYPHRTDDEVNDDNQ